MEVIEIIESRFTQRQHAMMKLIANGLSIKEAYTKLGYKKPRAYRMLSFAKEITGCTMRELKEYYQMYLDEQE